MIACTAASGLMHAGLSDPVSYLLTGVAAMIVAGVLVATGKKRMSGEALKPTMTVEQLRQDKMAAKEMVR